jgi:hypothetical protein
MVIGDGGRLETSIILLLYRDSRVIAQHYFFAVFCRYDTETMLP